MRKLLENRVVMREALLALLVLALTFLNFGHSSAVFAAGGRVVVTGTSICGEQNPGAPGDHFACHACRQDLPAAPPPRVVATPVVFTSTPVVYPAVVVDAAAPPLMLAARPRGPPVLV